MLVTATVMGACGGAARTAATQASRRAASPEPVPARRAGFVGTESVSATALESRKRIQLANDRADVRQRIALDVGSQRVHERPLDREPSLEPPHGNQAERVHVVAAGRRQQTNDVRTSERAIAGQRRGLRAEPRTASPN